MKIRQPSRLKWRLVIVVSILIILTSGVLLFNHFKKENYSPQPTQHGNNTPKDTEEQNIPIENNTNDTLSPAKPEASPPVLITNLSVSSSTGRISYTSIINGVKASQKCIFIARNDIGQQYSHTTTSTLGGGCSGVLENPVFSTGSSWNVTLQYKTSTSDVASRKIITIQ